ncbi:MAG: glycosyltransferase family 2 protein [Muribaculaceae bacterium]|nr:glycosyltransferase family 2 protein [Muribaculaceae bacterium]
MNETLQNNSLTPDDMNSGYDLDVLIASFGKEGLERLARLNIPKIDGVRWIISSQIPDKRYPPVPEQLQRPDILINFSDSEGLALNRNILLEIAEAPLCLIADDDQIFSPEGIRKIIESFNQNPSLSVAAFKYNSLPGKYRDYPFTRISDEPIFEKDYPDYSFPLDRPVRNFYISAIEIAFRLDDIKKHRIRFNERFGIKAEYPCGEDSIFLHDCLNAGMKGKFFPILIATHLGSSTGSRKVGDPGILRAQGVLIPLLYPASGFPRVILKAWRSSRSSEASFFFCLRHTMLGWIDFHIHKSELFPHE